MSRRSSLPAALAAAVLAVGAVCLILRRGPTLRPFSVAPSPVASVPAQLEDASARIPSPVRDPFATGAFPPRHSLSPRESERRTQSAGLRVVGVVSDSRSAPVAGARVELRLAVGERATLAEVTAVARGDGSYEGLIERWSTLPEISRSSLRLSGRASAPLLSEWRWTDADLLGTDSTAGGSELVRLDLRVEPGAMLTGRVLLADGRPCAGAVVRARSCDSRAAPWRVTDAHGRYAMPVLRSERVELAAIHRGFGVSDPVHLELDTRADARSPELVIRQGERLSGMVVYPDGKPAGRFALEAESTRADLDREVEIGVGLLRGRTETGLDGRFEFQGLLPGEYAIQSARDEAELGGDRSTYATRSEDARLTLRRHRLLVRVVDEAGRGVPGAEFFYSYPRRDGFVSAESRTIQAADGIEFIDLHGLDGPRVYSYEAATRSTAVVRGELVIDADRYETAIEIVLGPSLEPGRPRPSVRNEQVGAR